MRTFTAAGRKLGKDPLAGAPDALVLWSGWCADEVGRYLVLWHAVRADAAGAVDLVEELYRTGDLREKVAVIRSLPNLDEPERFVSVAQEAVRSNTLSVFEALSCDNAYPGAHLGEVSFNQMVIKAAVNGLSLGRIQGLPERRNAELSRMAAALASERQAAGRTVPADLGLLTLGPVAEG